MSKALIVLKCVSKGFLNVISGGVLGEVLGVANNIWDELEKEATEEERLADLQLLAQASAQEMRGSVEQVVREVAQGQTDQIKGQLGAYLLTVQAQVRRSFRSPSDPTGTTMPVGVTLRSAGDLASLLPPRLPRFRPGDRPVPWMDLEIVELLGVGGHGEVWKARNPELPHAKPVALKFCIDPGAAKSLFNERDMLSRVQAVSGGHRGIVQLQQTYLSADPPFLQYEYVEGSDLAGLIQELHRRDVGLSSFEAASIVRQIAEIVAFAHRLQPPIVHRDLKPSNILVEKTGDSDFQFKIADFGIGGISAVGRGGNDQWLGTQASMMAQALQGSYTPLYASAEQVLGGNPDPRDDVYALGVVWHQLLTGDLSRGAPSGGGWRRRMTEKGMTNSLADLFESSIESMADDRLPDAQVLLERLSSLLDEPPEGGPPPTPRPLTSGTDVVEWVGPVYMTCSDPGNLWTNRNPWMLRDRCENWTLHVRLVDAEGGQVVRFIPFTRNGVLLGGMKPFPDDLRPWHHLAKGATRDNLRSYNVLYRYQLNEG
jgi:serine/threonine protein kinase